MINYREIPFNEEDLKELNQLQINFAFQPIFDAANMELAAYEALMRPLGKSPLELIEKFHSKGIKVVAEGIEKIEELNFFRNNTSVDWLQGYYLGMPE